ncbi:MAG: hypothetical protein AAGA30_02755 [Planctomycetota bacterium]
MHSQVGANGFNKMMDAVELVGKPGESEEVQHILRLPKDNFRMVFIWAMKNTVNFQE